MKTQDELWAEYDRLVAAEEYESAGRVLDQIEPLSDEEWRRKLDEAPMDDEPVSDELRRRFEAFEASRAERTGRRAG